MDTRAALKENTVLNFSNKSNSVISFTILNEIARGGSSIVYNASYINNSGKPRTVRIKECYPFKLTIVREGNDSLTPTASEAKDFEKAKQKMRAAFDLGNDLFDENGLTNFTANTLDIYERNYTVYIVTTYQEGQSLSFDTFSTLKECVSIVKSVAAIIRKIHDKGYLYLDVKPDNILVLNGTTDIVQLFDFDSVVPIDHNGKLSKETDNRILFTRGFAAVELQTQQYRKIGMQTDVYAVGALLFYLLFGYAPTAPNCNSESVYNYGKCKFSNNTYQHKLFFELNSFFHHSLENYYLDRYQNMTDVLLELDTIIKLSDVAVPYIFSTKLTHIKHFSGRNNEFGILHQWLEQSQNNCLFITGMGGIESALIREYIVSNDACFDNVLYLYYNGSVRDMIIDDTAVHINKVEREAKETAAEYFDRKLRVLSELAAGTQSIIVIDNFCGELDKDFNSLINTGIRLAVCARAVPPSQNVKMLAVSEISDRAVLHTIFSSYSGKAIDDSEHKFLDGIIDKIGGHTLVLELIAKQVTSSHLSIQEACELLGSNGFSSISPEKVRFEKDNVTDSNTVKNIIAAIFSAENQSAAKRKVLKVLSLFSVPKIDINLFSKMLNMESKDDINDLINAGWISIDAEQIYLHPVIRETIIQWEWEDEYKISALNIMQFLLKWLRLDGKREEYPREILKINQFLQKQEKSNTHYKERLNRFEQRKEKTDEIIKGRIAREDEERPTDTEALQLCLRLSENLLDSAKNISCLQTENRYKDLLYCTVINMPRDREDYILFKADELLNDSACQNGYTIMKLYDLVVSIYDERNDFENALRTLARTKAFIHGGDCHVKAQYYNILADFYDARLGGEYYEDNEFGDLVSLLKSLNKAIQYIRFTHQSDSKQLLAKYTLSKANVLIRSQPERKKEISALLDFAKKLISVNCQPYSEAWRDYKMVCAWYFTLVEPYYKGVIELTNSAYQIAKETALSELDIIDGIIVPLANMLYELEMLDESVKWLKISIKACEGYNSVPYIRKKLELYNHLLDVCDENEHPAVISEIEKINLKLLSRKDNEI